MDEIKTYEKPILFAGGLHLDKQDRYDFQEIVNSLEDDLSYLRNYENLGLYDYLKREKIGYTFIAARSTPFPFRSMDEYEGNIITYAKLFEAQQTGDYDEYIEWLIIYGGGVGYGVTVSPSTEAAASFVAVYNKANEGDKQKKNPPRKGKKGELRWDPKKSGGRWVDDAGVYTWHDWEKGKQHHNNFGSWDGKTQQESFDGGNTWIP